MAHKIQTQISRSKAQISPMGIKFRLLFQLKFYALRRAKNKNNLSRNSKNMLNYTTNPFTHIFNQYWVEKIILKFTEISALLLPRYFRNENLKQKAD